MTKSEKKEEKIKERENKESLKEEAVEVEWIEAIQDQVVKIENVTEKYKYFEVFNIIRFTIFQKLFSSNVCYFHIEKSIKFKNDIPQSILLEKIFPDEKISIKDLCQKVLKFVQIKKI
jgi:hypothetical protein